MNLKTFVIIAITSLLSINTGLSQSTQILYANDSLPRFELRYLHAYIDDFDKQSALSGSYELAFSYPLSDNWNLNFSVPYAVAKYEFTYEDYGYGGYGSPHIEVTSEVNDKAWGNVMLGASYHKNSSNKRFIQYQGSICIPTATKKLQ